MVSKRAVLAATATALIIVGWAQLGGARLAESNSRARLMDTSSGADWAGYGRTYGEQHFSPLAEISDANIGQLGLAWSMDLGAGNPATTPLAVEGVLYFATGYSVVQAVDAASGKLLWSYDPKVTEIAGHKLRQGWGSRGIGWWNGKIYTGTHDGRLIALDAKTGKPVWTARTYPLDDVRYITGAPRLFNGMVIIGHGGADVGAIRGYVTAYDAETGKQLWRWYAVPGNPAVDKDETTRMASNSWAGEWWKWGGGGTVWNAITYDAETDSIILGTGNGSPWNHRVRSEGKGDNLFLCSIVALDAKTGKYKWHYQTNPAETWDYNAAMDMELADLVIDGQPRKVLMTAPKNGFLYVIDRLTGKLISAKPYVKVTWATGIAKDGRPIENPAARYPNGTTFELWPSPAGAHSWQAMAFSPKTGLLYIPAIEKGARYTDLPGLKDGSWIKDVPLMGVRGAAMSDFFYQRQDPRDGTSALIAWDPVQQREVWRRPSPGLLPASAMATAGNLVFQGGLDGQFNAYAADSGKPLWSFPAQAAVLAAPITYSVRGRQYVTVLAGMGLSGGMVGPMLESYHLDYRTQKKRVLTFVLGGKGKLPPVERVALTASQDPDFVRDGAQVQRGAIVFAYRCTTCHGVDAVAAGVAPDLRASPIPTSEDAFQAVVRQGALLANGMPPFREMTDLQLADLRHYLRSRAADLRQAERK